MCAKKSLRFRSACACLRAGSELLMASPGNKYQLCRRASSACAVCGHGFKMRPFPELEDSCPSHPSDPTGHAVPGRTFTSFHVCDSFAASMVRYSALSQHHADGNEPFFGSPGVLVHCSAKAMHMYACVNSITYALIMLY